MPKVKREKKRCYGCGSEDHLIRDCPRGERHSRLNNRKLCYLIDDTMVTITDQCTSVVPFSGSIVGSNQNTLDDGTPIMRISRRDAAVERMKSLLSFYKSIVNNNPTYICGISMHAFRIGHIGNGRYVPQTPEQAGGEETVPKREDTDVKRENVTVKIEEINVYKEDVTVESENVKVKIEETEE